MIPVRLIAYGIGALLVVSAATYAVRSYNEGLRADGRAEVQAQWDKQKIADKLAAEAKEDQWQKRYDTAINTGAKNAQALRIAANAAATANDSLRDTIDKLNEQLATADATTARKHAAAYQTVFEQCVREYRRMGEAAQGHANDAQQYREAWPK
jgi:preprotein translocase subunit SecF